ncbi:dTDP-4-dehydrorhamnose 3,5-epimerase family protein [Pseudonocardia nantongensis]|uniref:dTDP-4-dehydrorhamnose 3,5-epimerase family protein n=1 Tax=Pseudonocardia nantongensis TaxID=1181885 RepID=UPI00397DFF65
MHVHRTVVPGALLLDPSLPPPGHAGPTEPGGVPTGFRFRRRHRLDDGAVHGLHGNPTGPVLLGVSHGSGYAVVVDARPAAETFGRLAVALLDADTRQRLLVPPGCLYGAQAVGGRALVEVRSGARCPRGERIVVDPDDADLGLRWLRPRPKHVPGPARSWAGLCTRLGGPAGPRRDRVSIW